MSATWGEAPKQKTSMLRVVGFGSGSQIALYPLPGGTAHSEHKPGTMSRTKAYESVVRSDVLAMRSTAAAYDSSQLTCRSREELS